MNGESWTTMDVVFEIDELRAASAKLYTYKTLRMDGLRRGQTVAVPTKAGMALAVVHTVHESPISKPFNIAWVIGPISMARHQRQTREDGTIAERRPVSMQGFTAPIFQNLPHGHRVILPCTMLGCRGTVTVDVEYRKNERNSPIFWRTEADLRCSQGCPAEDMGPTAVHALTEFLGINTDG